MAVISISLWVKSPSMASQVNSTLNSKFRGEWVSPVEGLYLVHAEGVPAIAEWAKKFIAPITGAFFIQEVSPPIAGSIAHRYWEWIRKNTKTTAVPLDKADKTR